MKGGEIEPLFLFFGGGKKRGGGGEGRKGKGDRKEEGS